MGWLSRAGGSSKLTGKVDVEQFSCSVGRAGRWKVQPIQMAQLCNKLALYSHLIVGWITIYHVLVCYSQSISVNPDHGSHIARGMCGFNPMFLRTWTGYNWGEKPPYLCDHNHSFTWRNDSTCPGTLFIHCQPCPADYTSRYPDYKGVYGTGVNPGNKGWGGSPLNCTLTVARAGFFKNMSESCGHLTYCVRMCNTTSYCVGGDLQPFPCPSGKSVSKTSNFFGNISDCT
jgi:hypothetical protein